MRSWHCNWPPETEGRSVNVEVDVSLRIETWMNRLDEVSLWVMPQDWIVHLQPPSTPAYLLSDSVEVISCVCRLSFVWTSICTEWLLVFWTNVGGITLSDVMRGQTQTRSKTVKIVVVWFHCLWNSVLSSVLHLLIVLYFSVAVTQFWSCRNIRNVLKLRVDTNWFACTSSVNRIVALYVVSDVDTYVGDVLCMDCCVAHSSFGMCNYTACVMKLAVDWKLCKHLLCDIRHWNSVHHWKFCCAAVRVLLVVFLSLTFWCDSALQ